jgi:hypothetical protein
MVRQSSAARGFRGPRTLRSFVQTKAREDRELPFSSLFRTYPVPSPVRRASRHASIGLDPAEFRPAVRLRDFRTSSFRRREAVTEKGHAMFGHGVSPEAIFNPSREWSRSCWEKPPP